MSATVQDGRASHWETYWKEMFSKLERSSFPLEAYSKEKRVYCVDFSAGKEGTVQL